MSLQVQMLTSLVQSHVPKTPLIDSPPLASNVPKLPTPASPLLAPPLLALMLLPQTVAVPQAIRPANAPWSYTAPQAKVESSQPVGSASADTSWDARPPWSKSMATCASDTGTVAPIASLVVRRTYSLLPQPRHHLSIVEDDSIPEAVLSAPALMDDASGLAAALLGQRSAPALSWKMEALPLGKAAPEWEAWGRELLKEGWRNCPVAARPCVVTWLASSFALTASQEDVYTVPPALRSFDASPKQFLAKLMRDSSDADFARRLEALEMGCLFGGKSVPARKLVGMIAHRAIRDPREADYTAEKLFESIAMTGSTVDDGIAFVDKLLHCLAGTRE